jgi:hypothetical protein
MHFGGEARREHNRFDVHFVAEGANRAPTLSKSHRASQDPESAKLHPSEEGDVIELCEMREALRSEI